MTTEGYIHYAGIDMTFNNGRWVTRHDRLTFNPFSHVYVYTHHMRYVMTYVTEIIHVYYIAAV